MTVKKGWINRIRGWFPQEPYMISTRFKVDCETKQPPLMIPPGYTLSVTKAAVGFGIFWAILYGFQFFAFLGMGKYPISIAQLVAWIIAGISVGAASCLMYTKNQLGRFSKEYHISLNGKDMLLLLVPSVSFFIFGFFVSLTIGGIAHIGVLQGFAISVYAWGISGQLTRCILLGAFEKKENMRLMQSWWGAEVFLIPKAPKKDC